MDALSRTSVLDLVPSSGEVAKCTQQNTPRLNLPYGGSKNVKGPLQILLRGPASPPLCTSKKKKHDMMNIKIHFQ